MTGLVLVYSNIIFQARSFIFKLKVEKINGIKATDSSLIQSYPGKVVVISAGKRGHSSSHATEEFPGSNQIAAKWLMIRELNQTSQPRGGKQLQKSLLAFYQRVKNTAERAMKQLGSTEKFLL